MLFSTIEKRCDVAETCWTGLKYNSFPKRNNAGPTSQDTMNISTISQQAILLQAYYRLTGYDLMLQLIVDLLVQEDQYQHGPAHAPLIGAVLKQDYFKESGQDLGQQFRAQPQVLTNSLQMDITHQLYSGAFNSALSGQLSSQQISKTSGSSLSRLQTSS